MTVNNIGRYFNHTNTLKLTGKSTEPKPTGIEIGNGSEFIETDTGNKYIYNADNAVWTKINNSGGGSDAQLDQLIGEGVII